MEIVSNSIVKINKGVKDLNKYALEAQENNYPLTVYQDSSHKDNLIGVYTNGISKNSFAQNPFLISKDSVTIVKDKEYKSMLYSLNKEYIEEGKKRLKSLKTRRVPLNNRKDYNTASKTLLETSANYLVLHDRGNIASNNYIINPNSGMKRPNSICCSVTKTGTNDIVYYIQKSTLAYFGYNLADLKAYLRFLHGCNIGYEGKFLREVPLKKIFPNVKSNKLLLSKTGNIFLDVDKPWYEIFINGSEYSQHTYLRFIVTRFINDNKYWNIPFIAMKIKKNIPSLTNWECLLIAHANENYNSYYSLVGNNFYNLAIPSKYNSPESLLQRLMSSSNMNISFKLYGINVTELRNAIKQENFKFIEEIVKKYRDVN